MKKIVEWQLRKKCLEHADLTAKESEMSLQIAGSKNSRLRAKKQGDRQLISQRVARVAREIEGLASILKENNYESQPA